MECGTDDRKYYKNNFTFVLFYYDSPVYIINAYYRDM